jgi:hypothetical protein
MEKLEENIIKKGPSKKGKRKIIRPNDSETKTVTSETLKVVLALISEERKDINEIIDTSHLILEEILNKSFDQAANKYN